MKRITETFKRNKWLIKMAVPIFLELILGILIGNIDQFMLSSNATGVNAIIQSNTLMNVVIIAFSVLSTASIIMITQLKGAKDTEDANKIYSLSFYFNALVGVVVSLFLLIFCRPIFEMMGVDKDVIDQSVSYTQLTGSFMFLQAITTTFSAFFRSNRLMIQSTIVSLGINIINIVGNALAIYVFKSGVVGVAVSSTIARACGLIITVIIYIRHVHISLSPKNLFPFPIKLFKKLICIGLPSAGENLSYNFSQVIILTMINMMGVIDGNLKGFATNITMIVYMFANGICQAMQVVEGGYIGEGKYEKTDQLFKDTIVMSETVSLVMSIVLLSWSYTIFGFLLRSSEGAKLAVIVLSIDVVLELGRACNIVSVRALQTAGDINFPVISSIISCWVIAVGGTYLFGIVLDLGIIGCWIAMCLDECLRAIAFLFRWKKGVWKKKDLIEGFSPPSQKPVLEPIKNKAEPVKIPTAIITKKNNHSEINY